MLTNQEMLALLERRARRAEAHLEALEASPVREGREEYPTTWGELEASPVRQASRLQEAYLTKLQVAEESLAAAEALLLLEQERQAALRVILSAFPATTNESVETSATKPPQLTVSVSKS